METLTADDLDCNFNYNSDDCADKCVQGVDCSDPSDASWRPYECPARGCETIPCGPGDVLECECDCNSCGGPSDFETRIVSIAQELSNLVVAKNEAYGSSFSVSGTVMECFFPAGVPLDKLDDALAIVRVVDKLFRIATRKDAFGESPWRDIAGYALLAVERDMRNKEMV